MGKKKTPIELEEVPLEQIIKDRAVSMEKAAESISWYQEEIDYKENQLNTKIVEENISTLYNLLSYPLDHKKPKHVLKIEVIMLKKLKKQKEDSLEIMKELQIEDEGKNASRTS